MSIVVACLTLKVDNPAPMGFGQQVLFGDLVRVIQAANDKNIACSAHRQQQATAHHRKTENPTKNDLTRSNRFGDHGVDCVVFDVLWKTERGGEYGDRKHDVGGRREDEI